MRSRTAPRRPSRFRPCPSGLERLEQLLLLDAKPFFGPPSIVNPTSNPYLAGVAAAPGGAATTTPPAGSAHVPSASAALASRPLANGMTLPTLPAVAIGAADGVDRMPASFNISRPAGMPAPTASQASGPMIRPMMALATTGSGGSTSDAGGSSSGSGSGTGSSDGSGGGYGDGSGSGSGYGDGSGSGSYGGGDDLTIGNIGFTTTATQSDSYSTQTLTLTFTPNPDGTFTLDENYSYSYGDSTNGGSGSYDLTINNGTGTSTITLTESTQDSYNLSGSLTGGSDGGSFTESGNDSFHYTDSITDNDDGSYSETDSLDESASDTQSITESGTLYGGVGFNVQASGSDSYSYHDAGGDASDGSASDKHSEDDTSSDSTDLSENGGGLSVKDKTTASFGYHDKGGSSTPAGGGTASSDDTVTNTEDGTDSTTYDDSGPIDGGSFTAHETTSDTYDNSDTATVTDDAGQYSTSDDLSTASTNSESDHLTVSGIADSSGYGYGYGSGSGSGSGSPPAQTTDSIDETNTSSGSSKETWDQSHNADGSGSSDETIDSHSESSSDESGSDAWGSFDDSGSSDITVDTTDIDGDLSIDVTSSGSSSQTGSPPSGSIVNDASTVAEMAYYGPFGAAQAVAGTVAGDAVTFSQAGGGGGNGNAAAQGGGGGGQNPAPPAAPPAPPATPPPPGSTGTITSPPPGFVGPPAPFKPLPKQFNVAPNPALPPMTSLPAGGAGPSHDQLIQDPTVQQAMAESYWRSQVNAPGMVHEEAGIILYNPTTGGVLVYLYAGAPVPATSGAADTVTALPASSIPPGYFVVGFYHTHPFRPVPSPPDWKNTMDMKVPSFILFSPPTPKFDFNKYGSSSRIGGLAPRTGSIYP